MDKDSQYLFAFIWGGEKKSFLSLPNLKADLDTETSSQEDRIYLLKLLTLKGHKVSDEKLHFAQTQV